MRLWPPVSCVSSACCRSPAVRSKWGAFGRELSSRLETSVTESGSQCHSDAFLWGCWTTRAIGVVRVARPLQLRVPVYLPASVAEWTGVQQSRDRSRRGSVVGAQSAGVPAQVGGAWCGAFSSPAPFLRALSTHQLDEAERLPGKEEP